jgi:hypothetical protein
MDEAEWRSFLHSSGLWDARRGMIEEMLLFAYFSGPRLALGSDVGTGEIYERGGMLFGRMLAVGYARDLALAGVPYDGGDGEEFG